jgi:hypothetical protein
MSYQVGDVVRITATFENISRDVVDPATVQFVWRRPGPGEAETVWTYGAGVEIVRASLGRYYVELALDKDGPDWDFRWDAVGSGIKRVWIGNLRVTKSPFTTPPL